MVRLCLLFVLSLTLAAEDRWIEYRLGPFQVLTSAGEHPGKETLGRFEQFRWALGKTLGHEDLGSTWPIRILVFKKHQGLVALSWNREAFTAGLTAGAPIPRGVFHECAKILIESNTGRMPRPVELGIETLFSTLETNGVRITLGVPPPPEERNRDWARMHLLAVNQDYYGKLPVLLRNLEQGTEAEAAYGNALGKSPKEIDRLADAYLAAGRFETASVSGRPLNAEKDLEGRPVDPAVAALEAADVAFTREAYAAVLAKYPGSAGAHEGLGLIALTQNQTDAALREFSAAVAANSTGARAWLEYARLESNGAKAQAALEKAAQLNPRWGEPWFAMAGRATDVKSKIESLKNATRIEPRNRVYWRALAEADVLAQDYSGAAKAWAGAERASRDEAERAETIQARARIEQQRLDAEVAERKRAAEEKEKEIRDLKNAALDRIHEAEAKTNQSLNQDKPPMGGKVVPWWDGPEPKGKVQGVLVKVECLGKKMRLAIQGEEGKPIRLLVPDPSQLAVQGAGNPTVKCGEGPAGRKVNVAYFPKPDRAAGTAGEAAWIEFLP
jgi:hypothetical protein